jgi:hypothetical protein
MGDEGLHSLGVSLGCGLLSVTNQERSGLNASSPSGRGNGSDASRVRSRHAPARRTARRQAPSRLAQVEVGRLAPIPRPALPRS